MKQDKIFKGYIRNSSRRGFSRHEHWYLIDKENRGLYVWNEDAAGIPFETS